MKTYGESRTIWSNMILALLVWVWPDAATWVSHNPEVFTLVWAAINIALRAATRVPVTSGLLGVFICILGLSSGCSSMDQVLDPNLIYKRDLRLVVDGKDFEGVGVLPQRASYEIVVHPRGAVDMLIINSCHRSLGFEKISTGWFSGKFKYNYAPIPNLESGRICPLRVEVFDASKSKNSWSFMDFQTPGYEIQGTTLCNGNREPFTGVAVCQSRRGLVQRIEFKEPIRFAPPQPSQCETPKRVAPSTYEFTVQTGECLLHFQTQDGKLGRLTTIGHEQVRVYESQ